MWSSFDSPHSYYLLPREKRNNYICALFILALIFEFDVKFKIVREDNSWKWFIGISPHPIVDELPADLASSAGMKQVLSLTPLSDLCKTVTRFEGQLHKKTRVFGYKPKYVVLDRGVLTIFSTL